MDDFLPFDSVDFYEDVFEDISSVCILDFTEDDLGDLDV